MSTELTEEALRAEITDRVMKAIREWLPDLTSENARVIHKLLLKGDRAALNACRFYTRTDGHTVYVKDVRTHGGEVGQHYTEQPGVTERTLEGFAMEAMQAIWLAQANTDGGMQ